MRYLLDTHTIIWMREDDPRFKRAVWEPILFDSANEIFVSVVTLWEIAIKTTLGKLEIDGSIEEFARTLKTDQGFRILPIESTHLGRLTKLEMHHVDPFDRLLIAQAIETGSIAVTNDRNWKKYPVKIKW